MRRTKGTFHNPQEYAAGFILNLDESLIRDPARVAAAVTALAQQGFRSVWVTVRDPRHEVCDGDVLTAFRAAVRAGRNHGIEVWLGVGLNQTARTFARKHPECGMKELHWVTVSAAEGRVLLPTGGEAKPDASPAETPGVRAFHRTRQGVEEITEHVRLEKAGETTAATWSPELTPEGEVAVFVTCPATAPDYDSLAAARFTRELVGILRRAVGEPAGVWTDGVGTPRPPQGDMVFVGSSFAEEFKDRFGYAWDECLPSLAWELSDSGKVRLDLTAARADMVFRVQSMLRTECQRQFGESAKVGARHRDGGGEAAELSCGTADRFRFSAATLTGGFTESCFDNEPGMSWALSLARSLGKYHVDGYAANVSWGEKPTWDQVWRYTNLMCVQSVRWVAAADGDGDALPADWAKRVNEKFAWIGERTGFSFPAANVALVYNWRSAARFGHPLAEQYFRSVQQLAHTLSVHGIAFDILAPELVTTAEDMTSAGGFTRKEATYDALLYPWPVSHTPVDWEVLLGYLEDGGKAVLYGFPPEFAGGVSVGESFSGLFDCRLPSPRAFSRCREPIECRGQAVPVRRAGLLAPLPVSEAVIRTTSGKPLSVTNATRTCWYLSYDAGFMSPDVFVPLLKELRVRRLVESSPGALASLVGEKLVCVGLWGRSLQGATFVAAGKSVTLDVSADLAIVDLRTEQVEAFPPPKPPGRRCTP